MPKKLISLDQALLDIKVQRDQLLGHRRRNERQQGQIEETARQLVAEGKKERAMLALRRKKQCQQLALECDQHLMRLEELIQSIEMAQIQKDTVDALAAGTKTLKKVQASIGGIDYVQRILDEKDEAIE